MKLSEAIRHGSTLRPESHQERFCNVENRGLCSDAWGAACEAVWPAVAKLNWNPRDVFKFESAMNTLRGVQHKYFGEYFRMPACCPLSSQRFMEAGGRIINRKGDMKIEGERETNIGGVTSECDKVSTLAGFVDHAFYAHGNSREEIAEMVSVYENARTGAALARYNFEHFQMDGFKQHVN